MTSRLEPIDPADFDADQRRYYDALVSGPRGQEPYRQRVVDEQGRLRGPFNARLLDPRVGQAIQAVGAALRFESKISARWRELAILEVARAERSGHEWEGHLGPARWAGITEDELNAIKTGGQCSSFTTDDELVRTVVRELLANGDLDDELFWRAHARFGPEVVFDLVSIVGHYRHTALALRVWGVDTTPPVVGRRFEDLPPA